jgi:hypothetical protein
MVDRGDGPRHPAPLRRTADHELVDREAATRRAREKQR